MAKHPGGLGVIRAARAGDETAIQAFLSRHAETSMFLRANLHRFGLFDRDHPNATEYFVEDQNGITGVFGRSNSGFLLVQAPEATAHFWDQISALMQGRHVVGMSGAPAQVSALKRGLGLEGAAFAIDDAEPLYRLDLDQLQAPEGAEIRAPVRADGPLLRDWTYDYDVNTLGVPDSPGTRDRIKAEVTRMIDAGTTRLLIENGQPVAKTAFNAVLPDMVQIGGVYTPPPLRNRGYGRRVVAAHLAEARAQGVRTAILFASGAAA
ncbi:MAG TPA: N-acetyltransferase, partial [Aliiroseovarius sp.]|nr:N-acetyltransferase [Aliiroseovarius sp.]